MASLRTKWDGHELLTMEQIEEGFRAYYSRILDETGVEVKEQLLHASTMQSEDLQPLEGRLGGQLPVGFRSFVLRYRLPGLDLGNAYFGKHKKYVQDLLEFNFSESRSGWWGEGERPAGFLMVGATDGHTCLVALEDGSVHAFEKYSGFASRKQIASDFETFFRAAGTLHLARSGVEEDLSDEELEDNEEWARVGKVVADLAGAEDSVFWVEFAQGVT